MEFSPHYAAGALAVTLGKLAYGCGRYWWNKRTLREIYVARASAVQLEYEAVTDEQADNLDEIIDRALSDGATKLEKTAARRHKGVYRNHLVQVGQAKFGCPTRNEANRLTVRKFLYDTCVSDGLLARHINFNIDVATELVFVPSRHQLTAAAIRHTELSRLRQGVLTDLAGPRPTVA